MLKNQILEVSPATILKKVSQTFKKNEASSKSMMEQQSKQGLAVVKETEEEEKKEERKEEKAEEKEIMEEYPDEISLDPLTEKVDHE